ncbi:hypothetical protein AYO37_00570 [Opitutia bacterium SCGC AG-212-L18]|nr:hypothetical protein AYO37_00570 [Opitutae bacterium SCGC AG-212-L18]
MKTIKAEYIENFRCKVHHEASNSEVLTDTKKDATSVGFTPPELFVVSLVTCMATMIGYEAEALKLDVTGMKMAVAFQMSLDKPRRIEKISTEFWIPCSVTAHQKELIEKAAENCPIAHSIHPNTEQSKKFYWEVKT